MLCVTTVDVGARTSGEAASALWLSALFTVEGAVCEGVGGTYSAIVSTSISRVLLVPVSSVESAHLALLVGAGRIFLVQNVRPKRVAGHSIGSSRVLLVEFCLSITSSSAETWVDRTSLQQLIPEVCPSVGTIPERSIQSIATKILRTQPTIHWTAEFIRSVSITSGAPLTRVVRGNGIKTGTPERALDVRKCLRVRAAIGWIKSWIALEVNVERQASRFGIALLCAEVDIVAASFDDTIAQVVHSAIGSAKVLEVLVVSTGSLRARRNRSDGGISFETGGTVEIDVVVVGDSRLRTTGVALARLTGNAARVSLQLGACVDNDIRAAAVGAAVGRTSCINWYIGGSGKDGQRSRSHLGRDFGDGGRRSVRNVLAGTRSGGVGGNWDITQVFERKCIRSLSRGIRGVIASNGQACQSWQQNLVVSHDRSRLLSERVVADLVLPGAWASISHISLLAHAVFTDWPDRGNGWRGSRGRSYCCVCHGLDPARLR